MGIPERNEDFNKAADRLYLTTGSPIGAAVMEIADGAVKFEGSLEAPTVKYRQSPEIANIADTVVRVLDDHRRKAVAAAEQAEINETIDDAQDAMTNAQTLDAMSIGAEAFADELELEGSDDVAGYLRGAAKLVRKAARAARREAREMLVVSDAVLNETA